MNILYLTNHLNIGGITSYVFTLAKGMKQRGHNVFVASSGGETLPQFEKEGVTFIPLPIMTKSEASPKVIVSWCKLCGQIKKYNIDIIHANTRVTQVLASLVSRCTHRPYISTCHGFFKKRLHRTMFPCWGKRVIAISEQVREHLLHDFGVTPDRITVINHGIDTEKFRQRTKGEGGRKFGLGEGPVVGIVARLSDVKGHTYLIEAMREVVAHIPDAELLIGGEGKTKEDLAAQARGLGIEKNIVFIPNIADTTGVLALMDIFVMPSLHEGLGLGLMEAMASGLAVVGSRVGGIQSLIQHEVNGLLVEPKDSRGLAGALLELLNRPEKRKKLGDNARDFIVKNFSLEEMIRKTEGMYEACTKKD